MSREPVTVPRETCRDFEQSSRLEWLETNGTGAFAMGSVAGVNRRRYHGLLVAALPGQARRMLLARVEEEAVVEGRSFALGVCQYPGVVAPRGFELLEEFRPEPCAAWIYNAGGTRIEKQIYLIEGRQAVVVRYRADRALTLRVRPFVADRDYHSLQRVGGALALRHAGGSLEPPLQFRTAGRFVADANWYYNVEYLSELERGLDFREDLYSPGVYVFDLARGEWSTLCASVDGAEPMAPPARKRCPFPFRRADGKPGIIAGFPWFTDWGRDTMISLPGLLISQGQLDPAREILAAWIGMLKQGLIPNHFPDAEGEPEYNTADATLWMFQAMRALLGKEKLAAGGERAFLNDVFLPAAREIVGWHRRGTMYGIGVDRRDHLLSAGAPGTQLTWMDAKIGDRVVTPRHGKPVEINALWHSALCLMGEWGDRDCAEEVLQVRESFRAAFWNPQRKCLYDVVRDDGPDAKLRPNQIFAVSLGHSLLDPAQQQAVVRIVERELLTPVGLRTLERSDPDYKPHYRGGMVQRDEAYHQGTVWPWLLGPFVDAYLIAFGRTPETLEYCRRLVRRLDQETSRGPLLGSLAEIYDADEPRSGQGCPAQAWSVAEFERLRRLLLDSE